MWQIGQLFPAIFLIKSICIAQVYAVAIFQLSATKKKKTFSIACSNTKHARRPGPGWQSLPAGVFLFQIKTQKGIFSCRRCRRCYSTRHKNFIAYECAAKISQGKWQRW